MSIWDWFRGRNEPQREEQEKHTDASAPAVWHVVHQGEVPPAAPVPFAGHPAMQDWLNKQDVLRRRYPVAPGGEVPTSPKLCYRADGQPQRIVPWGDVPNRYDRLCAGAPPGSDTEGMRQIGTYTPFQADPFQRLDPAKLPDFLTQKAPGLPSGALPIQRVIISEVAPAPDTQPTLPPERLRSGQVAPVPEGWQPPALTHLPPTGLTPPEDVIADLPTQTPEQIRQAMQGGDGWLLAGPEQLRLAPLSKDENASADRKTIDPASADRWEMWSEQEQQADARAVLFADVRQPSQPLDNGGEPTALHERTVRNQRFQQAISGLLDHPKGA